MRFLFSLCLILLCAAPLPAQTPADLGAKIDALSAKIDGLASRVDRLESRLSTPAASRSVATYSPPTTVPTFEPDRPAQDPTDALARALAAYIVSARQRQAVQPAAYAAPEPTPYSPPIYQPAAVQTYQPRTVYYSAAPAYAPSFGGGCPNGQCGVRQRVFYRSR